MMSINWKKFFKICAQTLGKGSDSAITSDSWCSWTTFDRLETDAGYWTSGLPLATEIHKKHISDDGTWGETFSYKDIAHIIIPRTFVWQSFQGQEYVQGFKTQDLEALSNKLTDSEIPHTLSELVLEIKCY
ncbi:MAG: hypothetical protein GY808_18455 [Gammaproteobacteria bacterium]|nr:hypothetical protein [Gammaproteobacteria bacterium]